MIRIAPVVALWLLAQIALPAYGQNGLNRKSTLPLIGIDLPTVEVNVRNNRATFSFYQSQGADFSALSGLDMETLTQLKAIRAGARVTKTQIETNGGCPEEELSAGVGVVHSKLGNDKARFAVLCKANQIKMELTMTDEYVVNFVQSAFSLTEFDLWLDQIEDTMSRYQNTTSAN